MAVVSRLREVAVVRRGNKSDRILLGAIFVLSAIGLMMIYSATRSSGTFSMERQMIFVAAGLIMLLIFSNIDYREYRVMLPIISIVTLVLLGAVFLFDPVSDGGVGQAYRWIPLGFFNLQPSEFAKVVVILVLASLLAPERNSDEPPSRQLSWKKLAMALLVVGVPGVLIYEQPDLGTALVFGFVLIVLVFAAGATWRQMLTLIGAAVGGAVAVFQLGLLSSYQLSRIQCLFDPSSDVTGACYQLTQSMRAIGSGQLLGSFLADQSTTSFEYTGTADRLHPTAVAEQFGLFGAHVLAAFAVIIWRLCDLRPRRDRFGALIASRRRHDHVPRLRERGDDRRDHARDRHPAPVPQPGRAFTAMALALGSPTRCIDARRCPRASSSSGTTLAPMMRRSRADGLRSSAAPVLRQERGVDPAGDPFQDRPDPRSGLQAGGRRPLRGVGGGVPLGSQDRGHTRLRLTAAAPLDPRFDTRHRRRRGPVLRRWPGRHRGQPGGDRPAGDHRRSRHRLPETPVRAHPHSL